MENLDLALRLQLIHELLALLIPHLLLEIVVDLRLDFVVLEIAAGLGFAHADDVEPEWRFHDAAGLAGLEAEGGLLEGRDHPALAEEAEVASVRGRAGILRELLREAGEDPRPS